MFCEKCGEEATEKAKFCQTCGEELSKTETNQIEVSGEQSNQSHTEQHSEESPKNESKSFLGGVHHPWRRLFARTVDVMTIGFLIFLLFSFSIGYLLPQNIDGFIKFTENPIGAVIVLYLLWLPSEALFLSLTGTTPAKWIFGIRVTRKTGENLSYTNALKRAFLVFAQGEGFGIPFVTLFTKLFAYRRLTKTGTTLWDASINSVVTHKKWGVLRAMSSVFVTLVTALVWYTLFL